MLAESISHVLDEFGTKPELALDTETFGVEWDDKLFSLQISTDTTALYLNFDPKHAEVATVFDRSDLQVLQRELFSRLNITWFIHNSKFDMRRLAIEDCFLMGNIWDTMLMERYVRNNYFKYSLDECLKRRGREKDDKPKKWIAENKAYTMLEVPGKATKEKRMHFDRIPLEIIVHYGCTDAKETFFLGKDQQAHFEKNPELIPLIKNEMKLVKAVFAMEERGILLNREMCEAGFQHEMSQANECADRIEQMTSRQFKGGPKWLKEVLGEQGVEFKVNENGNAVFDKNALKNMDNAIASTILAMRDHEKKANSFYASFLRHADNAGVVHPNFNVGGTDTGRFSCNNPNIQQVPKEEKLDPNELFAVREAFIPRPDFIFVMMDYDQMEYRLMADYAGEHEMIEAIKNGLDPHTYVANMMGVTRKEAKTLNFGLLYGMGVQKLADSLGISFNEAARLKQLYFTKLPKVQALFQAAKNRAMSRGFIYNKYGRRAYLDDPRFTYKLVNYLIQGTGADVVRHALPKIHYHLYGKRSACLIQVHDELLFEIHKDELHLIPELRVIMESEYQPFNRMNLTCGVEWSAKSWALKHKQEGIPTQQQVTEALYDITRNQQQDSYGEELPSTL